MVKITDIKLIDRLFLIGPPGIGKTETIRRLAFEEARKLNKEFVDLREASDEKLNDILANPSKYYVFYRIPATHIIPEDIEMPRIVERYGKLLVEHIPSKILRILSEPDIHGTLFIDELHDIQRDDSLTILYSILQEREATWMIKLSKNIKIIAAGNPPEWSMLARTLPQPLINRLCIVFVEPPSVKEWIKYMNNRFGEKWEKLAGAYLMSYPEDLLKKPPDNASPFPSPRSWTLVSTQLYQLKESGIDYDDAFIEDMVIGYLGREVGTRFLGVLRSKIDVERLLSEVERNPQIFEQLKLNERILLLNAIAQQPVERLSRMVAFFRYLVDNYREFASLLIMLMDVKRRYHLIRTAPKEIEKFVHSIGQYL